MEQQQLEQQLVAVTTALNSSKSSLKQEQDLYRTVVRQNQNQIQEFEAANAALNEQIRELTLQLVNKEQELSETTKTAIGAEEALVREQEALVEARSTNDSLARQLVSLQSSTSQTKQICDEAEAEVRH